MACSRQPAGAVDAQRGPQTAEARRLCSRDAECGAIDRCFAPLPPTKGCGRIAAGCRIGDTCTDAGLCSKKNCTADADCPDNYTCTNLGFAVPIECRMKPCTRDDECHGFCVNGWCRAEHGKCFAPTPVY